jgi:transposase-like protein
MILACFVLGLSTRKVGEALLPILGRPVSPATVSAVAKQLDAVVAGFHARPLKERYRVLMLDGVVLARKTGAGAINGRFWSPSGCAPTAKRRSSTSTWRKARAPPSGSAFSAT